MVWEKNGGAACIVSLLASAVRTVCTPWLAAVPPAMAPVKADCALLLNIAGPAPLPNLFNLCCVARHAEPTQAAGSRASQRMASMAASSSEESVVPQASRFSSSCAMEVTPMMVLATRHWV